MKTKLKLYLTILLFLNIPLISSFGQSATSAPNETDKSDNSSSMKFDEISFDFGTVKQGAVLEHVFKFTNDGAGRLIVNSVQPSCGCTGVIMDSKKEFESGDEGEIKITFGTAGRSGVIAKTVTVSSNDPKNPAITLSFMCNIEPK